MKRYFTLGLAFSVAAFANAQCEDIPIPPTAIQLNSSGTTSVDGAEVWVCGGLEVTVVGSLLTMFIESDSHVQLIGQFNNVYVKEGGSLSVQGDSSIVQYFPTAMVNTNGNASVLAIPCAPLSFDYTDAPTPLCAGITDGIAPVGRQERLELGPNPAEQVLVVRIALHVPRSVSALDLAGREVLHADVPTDGTIEVSALAPGEYILRVRTDKGIVVGRFNKR